MSAQAVQAAQDYMAAHYPDQRSCFTKVSREGAPSGHLNSDAELYSFDEIKLQIFGGKSPCASADGLRFCKSWVEFIEFKTGFHRKITRENWEPVKGACPRDGVECADYRELFFAKADKETTELIDSVRSKAIDSYILWEKHLLPAILPGLEGGRLPHLRYVAVVDCDSATGMEGILGELAQKPSGDNPPVFSGPSGRNRGTRRSKRRRGVT